MRSFEDSTEAGGVAKAPRAPATYRHRGEGKGEAREPLLVDSADDEVKDYHWIYGQRIGAPTRTTNAELKPVNVEGRFDPAKSPIPGITRTPITLAGTVTRLLTPWMVKSPSIA